MEYQALYRRYRPQTFDDVIGQGHVTATLAREVVEGRVAHAYLFAGPRGTGKTTTARILAKSLNCANRQSDGAPDNSCESCVAITDGVSLDVLELDAASHNSVDDIREMRVSVTTVASTGAARRVFILDEAHMLSKAAGNALLKTLEEPPEHVHFVLATTEPYKLLDTIRSRAQRFDFHAISIETLAAHLAKISDLESFSADPQALVAVARHARGSARDSLSLLEQVAALGGGVVDVAGVNRALGLAADDAYSTLVEAIANQDARGALELVARIAAHGVDLRRFASEALGFFRGVFLAHYAPNLAEVADEPAEVLDGWKKAAGSVSPTEVLRAVDLIGDALVKLREGREERLMLELAMIKLTRPETATEPEALTARLERLERRLAAAGPVPEAIGRAEASVVDPATESESAPGGAADHLRLVESAAPTENGEEPGPIVPDSPEPGTDDLPAGAADDDEQSPAQVDMDGFRDVWPALFGGLRDVLGARRWALFRETQPGAVDGNTLVIEVPHEFHLVELQGDPAVAAIVATKAGDLLGGRVTVAFSSSGGPVSADPADDSGDAGDAVVEKDQLAEAPPDLTDPFRLVEEELGAQVVEEFDTGEG